MWGWGACCSRADVCRTWLMDSQRCTSSHLRLIPPFHRPLFNSLSPSSTPCSWIHDMVNVLVQNLTVFVDMATQMRLMEQFGLLRTVGNTSLPWAALNTDGIDPSGRNITIRGCSITNFDDAVAAKPLSGRNFNAQCTEDVLVEDMQITYSVGMTIGSVPPDPLHNCVRNVTFR